MLRAAVTVGVALLAIWLVIPTPDRQPDELPSAPIGTLYTMHEYRQIETGMSYEEVVELLGAEGTKIGVHSSDERSDMLVWTNPDGSRLTVLFADGRVESISELDLPEAPPR